MTTFVARSDCAVSASATDGGVAAPNEEITAGLVASGLNAVNGLPKALSTEENEGTVEADCMESEDAGLAKEKGRACNGGSLALLESLNTWGA